MESILTEYILILIGFYCDQMSFGNSLLKPVIYHIETKDFDVVYVMFIHRRNVTLL